MIAKAAAFAVTVTASEPLVLIITGAAFLAAAALGRRKPK